MKCYILQEAVQVPEQKCEQVEKEECYQVPRQVAREECVDVPNQVEREACKNVPRQVRLSNQQHFIY